MTTNTPEDSENTPPWHVCCLPPHLTPSPRIEYIYRSEGKRGRILDTKRIEIRYVPAACGALPSFSHFGLKYSEICGKHDTSGRDASGGITKPRASRQGCKIFS